MKRLLIVVDYQNDFVGRIAGLSRCRASGEEPTAAKIRSTAARPRRDRVHVRQKYRCDYLEKPRKGRNLPVEHCIEGAPGHAVRAHRRAQQSVRRTRCSRAFVPVRQDLFEWLRSAAARSKSNASWWASVSNICVISNGQSQRESGLPRRCPSSRTLACTASFDDSSTRWPLDAGGPAGPSDQLVN